MARRPNGSYIVISVRDSLSFLCMAYIEHLAAMDPLVGEALALVEAMVLARRFQWLRVNFECDSLLLCKEVHSSTSPSWAIADLVGVLRAGLLEFSDWRISWVPRRCNHLAHLLAKWAASSGSFGLFSALDIPEHIRLCDMHYGSFFP